MSALTLNLNPSLGCYFIGVVMSFLFYGVTCAQVLYYGKHYAGDPLRMKLGVVLLWILDSATTLSALGIIYSEMVTNHAQPTALFYIANVFITEYAFAVFVVFVVQCLRTTNRVIPGGFFKMKPYVALQTIVASVTDIYITICLTLILRERNTGFSRVLQILQFITAPHVDQFMALPLAVQVWAVFHFTSSKAYVNSLLAMIFPLPVPEAGCLSVTSSSLEASKKGASCRVVLHYLKGSYAFSHNAEL
ncbi:hypothetical protein FOMPIDRAFT_1020087 [Fomitopsis schrenkii]|uniref:Uncharacterized protein n=1 Tax=Fomitopsis schrenkii TaxID=2126942 RepID=S8DLE8_FOMSC|nr:hypothetical protein FOMPIDRAFT_1020087 [Fomitopsis schrenkii]